MHRIVPYSLDRVSVDVLVSELNFGAASRWKVAAQRVPVPPRSSPSKETPTGESQDGPKLDDSQSNFNPL